MSDKNDRSVKTLRDWLRATDAGGLKILIFADDEEYPVWQGGWLNVPWYWAEKELDYDAEDAEGIPIEFRSNVNPPDEPRQMGLAVFVK